MALEVFSLGETRLTSELLVSLSYKVDPAFKITDERWKLLRDQRKKLEDLISSQKVIYGVNTGFGFLSQIRIPDQQIKDLQLYLIRSHACGVGEPLSQEVVRGMLILKAHNFLLGHSGVRESCVKLILDFLQYHITPHVPSKGSVGASGDLAPLSHIALALIGEGKVFHKNEWKKSREVFQSLGLTPLVPEMKEGLALINGTHYMSVEGSFGAVEAERLIRAADIALALSLTGIKGTRKAFDPRIHELRPHKGQLESAKNIFSLLEGFVEEQYEKVQDPYSFRCGAQVHGMARDSLEFVMKTLEIELNSITDNPLVLSDGEVISGGNFHGAPIACAFDYLSIALSEIGNISERRTEKLTNPSMSGLPAFLIKDGGVNSGFMIPQVVAASLASENKVLAHPSSVDTIPTSADKEDHVSMGAFGAQKLRMITKNVAWILSIELLTACQAVDLSKIQRIPPKLKVYYDKIRTLSPSLDCDRSLHEDIEVLAKALIMGEFSNL